MPNPLSSPPRIRRDINYCDRAVTALNSTKAQMVRSVANTFHGIMVSNISSSLQSAKYPPPAEAQRPKRDSPNSQRSTTSRRKRRLRSARHSACLRSRWMGKSMVFCLLTMSSPRSCKCATGDTPGIQLKRSLS